MYAIVEISGKQFRVAEKDVLYVPKQDVEVDKKIKFDRVLLLEKEGSFKVGKPTISGASVTAKVVDHVRADKIVVFKKKRRKGYRVKNGHRQPYSQVRIEKIAAGK